MKPEMQLTTQEETVLRFLVSLGMPASISMIGQSCAPSTLGSEDWTKARIERLLRASLVEQATTGCYKATKEASARFKSVVRSGW